MGYKLETNPNNLGFVKGFNAGMGGYYRNISLDVSWGSMGVLGNLIQTTVTYKLNLLSKPVTIQDQDVEQKKIKEETTEDDTAVEEEPAVD